MSEPAVPAAAQADLAAQQSQHTPGIGASNSPMPRDGSARRSLGADSFRALSQRLKQRPPIPDVSPESAVKAQPEVPVPPSAAQPAVPAPSATDIDTQHIDPVADLPPQAHEPPGTPSIEPGGSDALQQFQVQVLPSPADVIARMDVEPQEPPGDGPVNPASNGPAPAAPAPGPVETEAVRAITENTGWAAAAEGEPDPVAPPGPDAGSSLADIIGQIKSQLSSGELQPAKPKSPLALDTGPALSGAPEVEPVAAVGEEGGSPVADETGAVDESGDGLPDQVQAAGIAAPQQDLPVPADAPEIEPSAAQFVDHGVQPPATSSPVEQPVDQPELSVETEDPGQSFAARPAPPVAPADQQQAGQAAISPTSIFEQFAEAAVPAEQAVARNTDAEASPDEGRPVEPSGNGQDASSEPVAAPDEVSPALIAEEISQPASVPQGADGAASDARPGDVATLDWPAETQTITGNETEPSPPEADSPLITADAAPVTPAQTAALEQFIETGLLAEELPADSQPSPKVAVEDVDRENGSQPDRETGSPEALPDTEAVPEQRDDVVESAPVPPAEQAPAPAEAASLERNEAQPGQPAPVAAGHRAADQVVADQGPADRPSPAPGDAHEVRSASAADLGIRSLSGIAAEFNDTDKDAAAGQTARKLLDFMAMPDGSGQPHERALAADTLLRLITRIPLSDLIPLTERICMMAEPPGLLVTKLINHPKPEVAGPLLERGKAITDLDLLQVIESDDPEKSVMIARRRALSSALCDALVAGGAPSVCLTIVRNPGANLSHDAFVRLCRLARDDAALQAPLATRGDTPAQIGFELFWYLPTELRRYILSRFLTDSATLDKILKIAMTVDDNQDGKAGTEPRFPDAAQVEAFGNAISIGDLETAASLLAELAGLVLDNARRIVTDPLGEPQTVAMKALGCTRSMFATIVVDWRSSAESPISTDRNSDELQAMFDSLSYNKARVLLTYWDWGASRTGPYAGFGN